MGRPPSNGGPSFRFNPTEVAEMEAILQAHSTQVPPREALVSLAEKFSNSSDRSGKVVVQMKQVWNWFQNRRYALRAKAAKIPTKLSASPAPLNDLAAVRNVPQAPQHISVPPGQALVRNVPQVLQPISSASVQVAGQNSSDNFLMEFEAKSARDGAWYDVATFISHRSVETTDPEVLVRFAGLGPEEDEWVNIRKHVRQRSLPCEATECVAVLPGDLILCFQEGKEQALYFDAHVLDAQRRRHDVRGCRCRFLVRYDHDQSEEIVPLKKVCRRPETDYRMQQLHAESATMNRNKAVPEHHMGNTVIHPSSEATHKLQKAEAPAQTKEQLSKAEVVSNALPVQAPISSTNASRTTAAVANAVAGVNTTAIVAPAAQLIAPVTTSIPVAQSNVSGATLSAASTTNPAAHFNDSGATVSTVTATMTVAPSVSSGAAISAANSTNAIAQPDVSGVTLPTASTTNLAGHFIHPVATAMVSDMATVAPITTEATLSAADTTNAAVHLIDSPATLSAADTTNAAVQLIDSLASVSTVPTVSATPVTHSLTSEAPPSAAGTTNPAGQWIDSGAAISTVTATPVAHSITSGASASTTQDANSHVVSGSATSAVTTVTRVANSNVAEATDSVVTTTTPVPSSNLAGASDSVVPSTTSTANSNIPGVTESVGTDRTSVAGSAVSEVTNSVATENI